MKWGYRYTHERGTHGCAHQLSRFPCEKCARLDKLFALFHIELYEIILKWRSTANLPRLGGGGNTCISCPGRDADRRRADGVGVGDWCIFWKLWAVDHSARVTRKSKANFVIYCELQNALIINLSNAHCGYSLRVAPFVWGSVVTSIVTFVSGGMWDVMGLMLCVEICVWRLIKVSLLWQTPSCGSHLLWFAIWWRTCGRLGLTWTCELVEWSIAGVCVSQQMHCCKWELAPLLVGWFLLKWDGAPLLVGFILHSDLWRSLRVLYMWQYTQLWRCGRWSPSAHCS